jgi:hypothetical protein
MDKIQRSTVNPQKLPGAADSDATEMEEMEKAIGDLADFMSAMEKAGIPPKDIEALNGKFAELQQSRAEITTLKTDKSTLQGQVANIQKKLEGYGKGTEKPACWATQEGRSEYIFTIDLTSTGFIVHDNALPHRADEQRKLPLEAFKYDTEAFAPAFRAMSTPLRDWSDQNNCRFFVRVIDLTRADEKQIYKRQLRTVGEYFYTYEP